MARRPALTTTQERSCEMAETKDTAVHPEIDPPPVIRNVRRRLVLLDGTSFEWEAKPANEEQRGWKP